MSVMPVKGPLLRWHEKGGPTDHPRRKPINFVASQSDRLERRDKLIEAWGVPSFKTILNHFPICSCSTALSRIRKAPPEIHIS